MLIDAYTVPRAASQPTTWGKSVQGIGLLDGVIWGGYGDWNSNTGPVRPWKIEEGVLGEHSESFDAQCLSLARNVGNELWYPNIDPSNNNPGVFVVDASGEWFFVSLGSPSFHVFDCIFHEASEQYVVVGGSSLDDKAQVWISSDAVTWTENKLDEGERAYWVDEAANGDLNIGLDTFDLNYDGVIFTTGSNVLTNTSKGRFFANGERLILGNIYSGGPLGDVSVGGVVLPGTPQCIFGVFDQTAAYIREDLLIGLCDDVGISTIDVGLADVIELDEHVSAFHRDGETWYVGTSKSRVLIMSEDAPSQSVMTWDEFINGPSPWPPARVRNVDSPSKSEVFGSFRTVSDRLDNLDSHVQALEEGGGSSGALGDLVLDDEIGVFTMTGGGFGLVLELEDEDESPSWMSDLNPGLGRVTMEPGIYTLTVVSEDATWVGDTTNARLLYRVANSAGRSTTSSMIEGGDAGASFLYEMGPTATFVVDLAGEVTFSLETTQTIQWAIAGISDLEITASIFIQRIAKVAPSDEVLPPD